MDRDKQTHEVTDKTESPTHHGNNNTTTGVDDYQYQLSSTVNTHTRTHPQTPG